ncbi:four-carbon acid sugar kinase family protein [Psychromicrobium xiongbiense]|uniref:four-carbon acid sugar kinase family protein n=1 Tax=Psychromicrobium xiongbiense TaxID=3051184 RepID=UPI002557B796|nr:four-carbon acid sugar kinase family protein [Psychromicrobium sp. YIM S02556]
MKSPKTVILDDDPTGTQSATGAIVLLSWDVPSLLETLQTHPSVYLQTNSRAISEAEAIALCTRIKSELAEVGALLGEEILVVLRGDSTLRGHVFAESDVFAQGAAPILFVPAFPHGGRTTLDSVHRLAIDGVPTPVGQTEYAQDPVFGFRSSHLVDYVREKGDRSAIPVSLAELRTSGGSAVTEALLRAGVGECVVPDVETDDDVELIHRGLMDALQQRRVVVRCAAPLAAMCADSYSAGLLTLPLTTPAGRTLIVCGSHTGGATAQLAALEARGIRIVTLSTQAAFADPQASAADLVSEATAALESEGIVAICSQRERRAEDNTLRHGELVMEALMAATAVLARSASVVISKGGITSAEVACTALGASSAVVRGQVLDGVSVWDLASAPGAATVQVVVPGNVGSPETIARVLDSLPR